MSALGDGSQDGVARSNSQAIPASAGTRNGLEMSNTSRTEKDQLSSSSACLRSSRVGYRMGRSVVGRGVVSSKPEDAGLSCFPDRGGGRVSFVVSHEPLAQRPCRPRGAPQRGQVGSTRAVCARSSHISVSTLSNRGAYRACFVPVRSAGFSILELQIWKDIARLGQRGSRESCNASRCAPGLTSHPNSAGSSPLATSSSCSRSITRMRCPSAVSIRPMSLSRRSVRLSVSLVRFR